MIDLAVFRLTCRCGSNAISDGERMSWHSSSVRVNAGVEYISLGNKYRRYDHKVSDLFNQLPVIAVAYVMDVS
jgi:hypothetical protein